MKATLQTPPPWTPCHSGPFLLLNKHLLKGENMSRVKKKIASNREGNVKRKSRDTQSYC